MSKDNSFSSSSSSYQNHTTAPSSGQIFDAASLEADQINAAVEASIRDQIENLERQQNSNNNAAITASSSNASSGKDEGHPDNNNLSASSLSGSSSSASLSNIRSLLTEVEKQKLDNQLLEAAMVGDPETIKELFQQGADVSAVDDEGWAALHIASYCGRAAIAQLLIDKSANVHAVDNIGRTALLLASIFGHTQTAQLLIENGANVNDVDNYGRAALYEASVFGYTQIAQLLIENGADVNVVDDVDRTALHWASRNRRTAIAQLLIDNGANVYLANQDLSNISQLVSPLKEAHETLRSICLSDENNQDEAVLDRKINRIRSELLINYPNLIISPLDEEGNTILNLIANKIASKETAEEKDDLLRLFVELVSINSSKIKKDIRTNVTNNFLSGSSNNDFKDLAKIIAVYSGDNKKGGTNPIDKILKDSSSPLNENGIDQNLIQAFFMAGEQGLWQNVAYRYSQASSSDLGQTTAGGSASSSSSSSFTAGSSNNNATTSSGKDEASSSSSYSSAAAAAKGSSSSSIPPVTNQENRDLQAAINASLQDLERQPLAATAASAVSISSGINLNQITSTYPSQPTAASSFQERNRANLPNDNLASSNLPSSFSSSSSSSSNSKKRSFFSRLFSCSSPQEEQPSPSPSNPEGKGTAANKKGQGK